MSVFEVRAAEEGVEKAAFADIAAAEEGDFGDRGGREGAELRSAVEEMGWGGVEVVVGVFELGGVWWMGDGVGVQGDRVEGDEGRRRVGVVGDRLNACRQGTGRGGEERRAEDAAPE